MSPVQDDDSEDDFAPAKPQANDDARTTSRRPRRTATDDDSKTTSKQLHNNNSSRASLHYWGISTVMIARTTAITTTPGLMILGTRGCSAMAEPFSSVFSSTHRASGWRMMS